MPYIQRKSLVEKYKMKLAKNWHKAYSTYVAAFLVAAPTLAPAFIDLAPFLGEYGRYALVAGGLLTFIARVWPQDEVDNA